MFRQFAAAAIILCALPSALVAEPVTAIAMHGTPALEPDFAHLPYVNPNAPKGGTIRFGVLGSFDTLNPYSGRGVAAPGIRDYVFESLMTRSFAEPFSLYGLLAERVEMAPDRSWISFELNPKASFSDGHPVSVDDVVFSYQLLRDHGHPNHRAYYAKVAEVSRTGERGVRFSFVKDGDREMPLIVALMPILPRHATEPARFEETSLAIPVGSGPYLVSEVSAPDRLVLSRRPDYWGADLPINRGRFNFDRISYDHFRESNALFEAFKKGLYDVRVEEDPARWAQGYDFPAVTRGEIVTETFATQVPAGMSGLVFNTRRHPFSDIRVRHALTFLFDFEWINQNMLFGAYRRTQSFFDGSELASVGHVADEDERKLLAPYLDRLPADVMNGTALAPRSDGSGRNRDNQRNALDLLQQAGYSLADGRLVDTKTGTPLTFEFLAQSRDQERIALAFARALERSGIVMQVRSVDAAQYQRRIQEYDFDMMQWRWYVSLSPGNEQRFYWGAAQALQPGSRNYAGIRDPGIDAMIVALLAAHARPAFVSAVRALDRLLIAGHYVIPLYHQPEQWVARWAHIGHPQVSALDGYKFDSWWFAGRLQ